MINIQQQKGATIVEFVLIAVLFFALFFTVIEFGRALFVWNALTEATRRGARMAIVCPVDSPIPKQVALFNGIAGSGNSSIIRGLTSSNVSVTYYNVDGGVPATQMDIKFVKVAITGYTLQLLIPLWGRTLTAPDFTTTLYSESLGTVPAYPPATSTSQDCAF